MSWDKGFNFRATSAYVTDGVNQTYVLAETTAQTRNGVTFQWDANITASDRNSANDVRIAGVNKRTNNGTQATFSLTLPATGNYNISIGLGDSFLEGYQYVQIRDNGSAVLTITKTSGTASNHYVDATGTDYTSAAWPGSEAAVQVTFATTTFQLVLGSPTAQTNSSTLAHLFLSQVASGGQLFLPSGLAGLGSGGPFFGNPIG